MTAWLVVIGSTLAIIIGLWKFFAGKRAEKRERITEADAQFKQGVEERDPRKIIGANDRLNNDL